jgi:hypothetical protein
LHRSCPGKSILVVLVWSAKWCQSISHSFDEVGLLNWRSIQARRSESTKYIFKDGVHSVQYSGMIWVICMIGSTFRLKIYVPLWGWNKQSSDITQETMEQVLGDLADVEIYIWWCGLFFH